jgi:hypothetical protein
MNEPTPMNQDDQTTNIDSIANILELITKLGGVLVGIVVISYLVGRTYLISYYSVVGTPWVLSNFTSDQIAKEGITTIYYVVLGLMFSITWPVRGLQKLNKGITIGLIPLFLTLFIPSAYLSPRTSMILSMIVGDTFAFSAGMTMGTLITDLKGSRSLWNGYHLTLILFVYFVVVNYSPSIFGQSKATLDMDVIQSTLPFISKDGITGEQWRMITPIGDKFLIVSLNKEAESRLFKVITAEDSWRISAKRP